MGVVYNDVISKKPVKSNENKSQLSKLAHCTEQNKNLKASCLKVIKSNVVL